MTLISGNDRNRHSGVRHGSRTSFPTTPKLPDFTRTQTNIEPRLNSEDAEIATSIKWELAAGVWPESLNGLQGEPRVCLSRRVPLFQAPPGLRVSGESFVLQPLAAPMTVAMASANSVLVVTKAKVSTLGNGSATSGAIDSTNCEIEHRPYPHAKHEETIVRHDASASWLIAQK